MKSNLSLRQKKGGQCEDVRVEIMKNGNMKQEIRKQKSVGEMEEAWRGWWCWRVSVCVGGVLIGINDGENPPIRAFSCVAG